MGIFSIFKSQDLESRYNKFASKIVVSALFYFNRSNTEPKISVNAGAEVIYMLLHLVDKTAFKLFDNVKRDQIFDEVYKRVVSDYCKAVSVPRSDLNSIVSQMTKIFNERQLIYSQCKINGTPEFGPSAGTLTFALFFYIHKALGRTERKDADDVLTGKSKLKSEDMLDFPSSDEMLLDYIYFTRIIIQLQIEKQLKRLG